MTNTELHASDSSSPRCGVVKGDGSACMAYRTKDSETCYAHSGKLGALASKAAARSAEVRRARVQAREKAVEDAQVEAAVLARASFDRELAEHHVELAAVLRQRALGGDLRAAELWLNRTLGGVGSKLELEQRLTSERPKSEWSADEIAAWLAGDALDKLPEAEEPAEHD